MQFDCACLCHTVSFQMNSWENSVAFCPAYIPVSPPTAMTTILPSRSIISILSFALFLFLSFWLALWTKHGARCHCKTCLLPSQVLSMCSSAPLRAPELFPSVQLLCSLQKSLHLALVFFKPTPSPTTSPFLLSLHLPLSLQKKTGSECRCPTHLSSLLILSFALLSPKHSLFLAH